MEVRTIVQQLLLEHGVYSPLELLLATNRLSYEDYRAWRKGGPASLDAVLAGGADEARALLEAAEAWARTLDLASEPALHQGWEENAGVELRASEDPRIEALLNTRFLRARKPGQLDLFMDSAGTAAVNALRDALWARDARRAGRELERLASLDPDHGQRAAVLIAALRRRNLKDRIRDSKRSTDWSGSGCPPHRSCSAPAAGTSWRPCGGGIGRALDPACFDAGRPNRHASWAYLQGLDWENLRRSVLVVQGYETEPVLLVRLAEAEWRLRNRTKAIEHWFALCRCAPGDFEKQVEAPGFPDWALARGWRIAREQDLEPEMSPRWFPAWMLLEDPGLARVLAPCGGESDPERAFDVMMALLADTGLDERGIAFRRELQAIHPGLLASFLAKRV